ncbi:uncharacterized protein LOC110266678 isoform X2 [Arachis ipaensis]|uniref:uncharacterized protein LOC110266678 isoform X2 n=1 Tax=Arachis ipaensis TaxID=130454 RepID=UPI000A2B8995|nr:uncharacterized protein LOC110266678 isoform X2 [Arachis ipaensis]
MLKLVTGEDKLLRHPLHSNTEPPVCNPHCVCSAGNVEMVAASVIIVGAAVSVPVRLELSLLLPQIGDKGAFCVKLCDCFIESMSLILKQ